jgi:transposase
MSRRGRWYARPASPSLLLQAFYTVRSERQLMEQLDYNLLFPLVRRALGR